MSNSAAIDRKALVRRHNPIISGIDPLSPLSVGNGEFAFGMDVTGLQTFYEAYLAGVPLCTMAQWAWHRTPKPAGLGELKYTMLDARGRKVPYAIHGGSQTEIFDYLRENPHRFSLARLGFRIHLPSGRLAKSNDLRDVRQELDLYSGVVESRFAIGDLDARVRTAAHSTRDAIGVMVEGTLLEKNLIGVEIAFGYPTPEISGADWERAGEHRTEVVESDANSVLFARQIDDERYGVRITYSGGSLQKEEEHHWILTPAGGLKAFWFCCEFLQGSKSQNISAEELIAATEKHWGKFWESGLAVDFSQSSDARAGEIQRRIILSQYLTAIQCAGSMPPQETGLTCNSWNGKSHLEMHYWHSAHFASWQRIGLLERSLDYYQRILPGAVARAKFQGYAGARWPKMTDPAGDDSPSPIGPLLIWQQPHPIVYAELCYQAHPDRATLEKFAEVVQKSAEFMASYAAWEPEKNRYCLGPPVIPAQENHPPEQTWNPTFELSYWRYALALAQVWRKRMGLPAVELWNQIIAKLAKLPVGDGVYLAHENCPQTFTERNRDHPSMLYSLGVLPGDNVDQATMRRTLQKVIDVWKWDDTWGWDYGACAMTATALQEDDLAMDLLLRDTPKNHYAVSGHNYQRENLPVYLPGNGALLLATAKIGKMWKERGWNSKTWNVRVEES